MNKELISVIVPIYNVEKYLGRCVDSILNQNYKNIEIILVDDGSTDSSGKIADLYEKKSKMIKTFHKENGGLSDARNFGIKKASGNFIGFIDSDDYIEPQMFELLYENIIKDKADISICGRFINYEDGREIIQHKIKNKIVMTGKEGLIYLNSFKYFDMSACDKLYRKSLFNNIEFPKGFKCEDYYTMYKLFDKSKKIVFDSQPMYHYFQREGSITRNNIMDTAFIEASKSQICFFEEKHSDILYIAYTAYSFANISYFNKFIKYKIKCPKNTKNKLKKETKKYLKYVFQNRYISKTKKAQAAVFCISPNLYAVIKKLIN